MLLCLQFVVLFIHNQPKPILYKAGTFEGVGQGHHGEIRVLVVTDEYAIKDIQIIEAYEMPEISEIVFNKIPKMVIEANSSDIDVVTGASYTSHGLMDAINDGLDKAKVNP